jgi:signal peptidase I
VVFFLSDKGKVFREILSWLLVIVIPVVLVFVLNVKVFALPVIDQSSMHNTLFEGDLVYVDRFADDLSSLKREDVILFLANGREKQGLWDEISLKFIDIADRFRPKEQKVNERYVKRIIGLPGDVIDITPEGAVYINGELENKSYVVGLTPPRDQTYPLTVPEGHLFVLGDNREISKDSRNFGCISIKSVEGKVRFLLWPLSRVGTVK